jgi:hypothetical protein
MVVSDQGGAPNWGWGTSRQLWACRLSHALGLVVVLGMLVALGATSSGRTGLATASAAEIRSNTAPSVADNRPDSGLQSTPAVQTMADQRNAHKWAMDGLRSLAQSSVLSAFPAQRAAIAARLNRLLAR